MPWRAMVFGGAIAPNLSAPGVVPNLSAPPQAVLVRTLKCIMINLYFLCALGIFLLRPRKSEKISPIHLPGAQSKVIALGNLKSYAQSFCVLTFERHIWVYIYHMYNLFNAYILYIYICNIYFYYIYYIPITSCYRRFFSFPRIFYWSFYASFQLSFLQDGNTPLHTAAISKPVNPAVIQSLLDAGQLSQRISLGVRRSFLSGKKTRLLIHNLKKKW